MYLTTKSKDFDTRNPAFTSKFGPRKKRITDRSYKKLDYKTAKEISAASTKSFMPTKTAPVKYLLEPRSCINALMNCPLFTGQPVADY